MQTIYNHKTGETHTGQPVDCAEIMATNHDWHAQEGAPVRESAPGGYPLNPDGSPGTSYPTAPNQEPVKVDSAALGAELRALPNQVKRGDVTDVEAVVLSLRTRYGVLFTADNELAVRALFPAVAGTGRPSAKVGK